jgi:hypothetical protein
VPLTVLDSSGGEVGLEKSEPSSPVCAEVKGRHQLALGVGTFTLRLGPTSVERVGVVIEPASHGGHAH